MQVKEPKCSRRRLRNHVTASPGLADGITQNDDWNPIGGARAPEYVPEVWTGPHVGLRLVEAFMTMANMPMTGIGTSAVGFWPRYSYTWEDLLAQEESDDLSKSDTANKANSAKIRPSAQEVSRMEQAISWPGRYCQQVSIARIVQRVAHYRSRDIDMSIVARKMKQIIRCFARAIGTVSISSLTACNGIMCECSDVDPARISPSLWRDRYSNRTG